MAVAKRNEERVVTDVAWPQGKSWVASKRSNPMLRSAARWCERYLRAYNNQFNWDFDKNGERFVVEAVTSLEPGPVFDVGANVGSYSKMCAEIATITEIHAFEISPPTFEVLERNCQGLTKVYLNAFGLSDTANVVTIYHAAEASARTGLHLVEDDCYRTLLTAEVRTGDQYLATCGLPKVSFLKIDVEGCDLSTLKGFEKSLQEGRISAVQFEHGEPSVESRTFLRDIVRFLAQFDLKCFHLFPQSLEPVDQRGYRMEDFRGRNYVALSADLAKKLAAYIFH